MYVQEASWVFASVCASVSAWASLCVCLCSQICTYHMDVYHKSLLIQHMILYTCLPAGGQAQISACLCTSACA